MTNPKIPGVFQKIMSSPVWIFSAHLEYQEFSFVLTKSFWIDDWIPQGCPCRLCER